jgi:hypothetical protein
MSMFPLLEQQPEMKDTWWKPRRLHFLEQDASGQSERRSEKQRQEIG